MRNPADLHQLVSRIVNDKLHSEMQQMALPPGDGPKLQAFRNTHPKIEWLGKLGDEDSAQGIVFKVRIKNKLYAIKVVSRPILSLIPTDEGGFQFKGYNLEDDRPFWEPIVGKRFPREEIAFHIDPFFAECRAYGRLKDAQQEQLAIRCHGYIFLSDEDKEYLTGKGYDSALKINSRVEVRALVKDLATDNHGIHYETIKNTLKDIKALNELGIYKLDVRVDNYRDGKLVDFGSSWTEEHNILSAMDDESAAEYRIEDLVMFDQMVAKTGIRTTIRARPNPLYLCKLRSHQGGARSPPKVSI